MANKKWGWLTTGVTTAVVGAVDQQLIHQSGAGRLGKLTPAQAQGLFAGALAVGTGTAKILSKRESPLTRLNDGGFFASTTLLGMSAMHQGDQMMAKKATTTTTTTTTGNIDTSADTSITSASADSTQDASAAITSSSDLSDAFAG